MRALKIKPTTTTKTPRFGPRPELPSRIKPVASPTLEASEAAALLQGERERGLAKRGARLPPSPRLPATQIRDSQTIQAGNGLLGLSFALISSN